MGESCGSEGKKLKPEKTWWVISGKGFLEALYRAYKGESPEIVYIEYYANSEQEVFNDY